MLFASTGAIVAANVVVPPIVMVASDGFTEIPLTGIEETVIWEVAVKLFGVGGSNNSGS